MTSRRAAFIDIGTNTVLCLIVECEGGKRFTVLDDLAEISRLGQGVDQTRRISEEGESRTAAVLRRYLERCRELGAVEIVAVGTSALRDASNSAEVRQRWLRQLGVQVRVISGVEEAACSFLAVREGLPLAGQELLVIDIGGGSTEFIRGNSEGVSAAVSLDVGSVRLTERFLPSDPVAASELDALSGAIDRQLSRLAGWRRAADRLILVGIAGTFTTLVAVEKRMQVYSHGEVHGSRLSRAEVTRQRGLFQSLTVAQRKRLPGLEPKRADVIFAGACLIERIMTLFDAREIIVSDQGVRYGLLHQYLAREKTLA